MMRFEVSGTLVIKIPSVLEGFQSDKQLPSLPPLLLFLALPATLFTCWSPIPDILLVVRPPPAHQTGSNKRSRS